MTLKTAFLVIAASVSALWPNSAAVSRTAPALNMMSTERNGITNGGVLDSFFRRLAATEAHTRNRSVRIMQYGDSHTKADLFTGAVRKFLLRDFSGEAPQLVRKTSYRTGSADSQAIIYQPLGINGARAKRLRDMSESEGFLQGVSQSRPDLIVIAYGTNEVTDGDWTVDSYSRMLVGIINRLRSAAPEASFLIIGPPDRSVAGAGGWTSVAKMQLLLEAQHRAAELAGAALWSEYDAMGGGGSMNAWVSRGLGQSDHVHFTGAGYYRLAALFYRDLMTAYRNGTIRTTEPAQNFDLKVMRGVPVSPRKPL
jgi:lysophospholipase L1-like esterase